jgi:hypothetical protein
MRVRICALGFSYSLSIGSKINQELKEALEMLFIQDDTDGLDYDQVDNDVLYRLNQYTLINPIYKRDPLITAKFWVRGLCKIEYNHFNSLKITITIVSDVNGDM